MVLVVTGLLENWIVGRPVEFFNWLSIASPVPRNFALREVVEISHSLAARLLYPLLALHVLGALKHALLDRDNVLRRIFVPAKE